MSDAAHAAGHARRRCIVCLGLVADHTPARLSERGFRSHEFDPGERRAREPKPRAVVWTVGRRLRHRELTAKPMVLAR